MGPIIPRSDTPLNGGVSHRARATPPLNGTPKVEPSPPANARVQTELAVADHTDAEHDEVKPPSDELSFEDEGQQLRAELEELRARNAELERTLEDSGKYNEEVLAEKQKELETLLEEKSEVIRDLHRQIRDLEGAEVPTGGASGGGGSAPREEELLALSEELERERTQLKEDEESLM